MIKGKREKAKRVSLITLILGCGVGDLNFCGREEALWKRARKDCTKLDSSLL